MLLASTLSPSAKIAIALIAGIMVFSLTDLMVRWMKRHHRRVRKQLYREAWNAHQSVLAGLRQMADVFAKLPEHPRELSRQGVQLLDAQARAAESFDKLFKKSSTMSGERRRRFLIRECQRFHDQESLFSTFQDRVLRAVSDQARRGVVAPPSPGRCYRAIFTILKHDLPQQLWPAMNETLTDGVELRMQAVDGAWHPVPLKFTAGGRAAFSRKFLERAVALKMIIGLENAGREVFEYRVSHALPVKPVRRFQRRMAKGVPAWLSGVIQSSS